VGASLIAEKLLGVIRATPMHTGTGMSNMTASIGISGLGALRTRELVTAEMLLDQADQCLYKSKRLGRDRVTMAEIIEGHFDLSQSKGSLSLVRA
jgi:PleD family two-component response regulator